MGSLQPPSKRGTQSPALPTELFKAMQLRLGSNSKIQYGDGEIDPLRKTPLAGDGAGG